MPETKRRLRKREMLLRIALALCLIVGLILAAVYVHSRSQLQTLQSHMTYSTPQEGTRALINESYTGIQKVEIVHAGRDLFDDLWFVEAHVWAASRSDGKGFSGRDYDNPGWFFLRVQNDWVFVPEGKFPVVIAFGKWLFGLSG